eukprot:TRINITY_DN54781_c0_g1_i1.p1 TRINITY_DN54781_c0_g1~~TRINITY_DN54781_c0_g1_i1.p1  ORF type:complete len:437 (+),score=71.74 TRINITY_DN54781_c0_g1_i1:69-1379(+)
MASSNSIDVPYEVRREWSAEWDLAPLLRGESVVVQPCPTRFLHPSLEVRNIPGRGRGVVAARSVDVGTLLLLDTPLLTSPTHGELVEAVLSKAGADTEFRRTFLSMCGDPEDDVARASVDCPPCENLVRNIVRHNYHGVEEPPKDGELCSATVVGMWPLGSLVNHSLRPNVARTFLGHTSFYRSILPIAEGEEVLDNYFDLRLPFRTRKQLLSANHSIENAETDEFDANADVVAEIEDAHQAAFSSEDIHTKETAQAAFTRLLEVTNRCHAVGTPDPAFTTIFRDFGMLAGQLGDIHLSLQGLAKAFEVATVREPYSLVSVVLSSRMLSMACLGANELDIEVREQLEAVARKHLTMVYGPFPDVFEVLNPVLSRRLAILNKKRTQRSGERNEVKKAKSQKEDCTSQIGEQAEEVIGGSGDVSSSTVSSEEVRKLEQ